ncbi:hypothetical protein V5799_026219 [Amblyomma americanum]|uniref:Uncharacterized protein n=1 Tax=Amblyomma americanum TaxID=6943 RepID=A0AAQ4DJ75_AMBAM
MATSSAQMTSLESNVGLQLQPRNSQRLIFYAETQLKEKWNELENVSTDFGKTVKKYKEHETISGSIKTNWKDQLEKTTLRFNGHFNNGNVENTWTFPSSSSPSEPVTDVRTETVQVVEEGEDGAQSNKQLRLQVEKNKLLTRELLRLQRNFSDEPLIDEECGNARQEPLSPKEKNLVQAAYAVMDNTDDGHQKSERANMPTESVAKKQPEIQPSDGWFLKKYSMLKETALSNGWATYVMGNLILRGHFLTVGAYLKKRGFLLSMHMYIEMQIDHESTSWPLKEGIRLLLLHPKKGDYCTIEAKGEGSLMLCQSAPEAQTTRANIYRRNIFL